MRARAMARRTRATGTVALSRTIFSTSTLDSPSSSQERSLVDGPGLRSMNFRPSPRENPGWDVYRTSVGSLPWGGDDTGWCATRGPGGAIWLAGGLIMMKVHNVEPVL